MKIFKYPIELINGAQVVEMPEGAQMLHAQLQGSAMFVWAMVDENKSKTNRKVRIIGTGWEIEESTAQNIKYINTIHTRDGFVWHIFEDLS